MTEKDKNLMENLLQELENAFQEGKIDEPTYSDFKARYLKKLGEITNDFEKSPPIEVNVAGNRVLAGDTMIVTGSANIVGGNLAKNLHVKGSARIAGNLQCLAVKVEGNLDCGGNIEALGEINCAGALKIAGSLRGASDAFFASIADISGHVNLGGNLRSTGSLECGGHLKVGGWVNAGGSLSIKGNMQVGENVTSSGMLDCHGNFRSHGDVTLSGAVTIHGNATSDRAFESTGKMQIHGNLAADTIQIGNPDTLSTRRFNADHRLSVIHGNLKAYGSVFLMDCEVKGNVTGNTVSIGPNTIIHGNVRFVKAYECAEDADVHGRFQQLTLDDFEGQFSKDDLATFRSDQAATEFAQKLASDTKRVPVEPYDSAEEPVETQNASPMPSSEENQKVPNYCPGCGHKIERFMRFCPTCGTNLLNSS